MIGKTGQDFLDNSMNWNSDKLAILFMSAYERPSYDPNINHFEYRKQRAIYWYNYIENIGPTPPHPTATIKRKKFPWVLYARKLRNN